MANIETASAMGNLENIPEMRSVNSELSRRELVQKTSEVLNEYPERIIKTVRPSVRKGLGRSVVGDVEGRADDEFLWIDMLGEHILQELVQSKSIPAKIYGEHAVYVTNDEEPLKIIFASDSFDNTSQYKRRLDTPPYSVAGAYHVDGHPIGASVVDIKDKRAYVGIGKQAIMYDYESDKPAEKIKKSEKTTIKDPDITIATYLGSNEYSVEFFKYYNEMVRDMHPKGMLYAGGGSYIYGLLASGAVDAYVMVDELRGEIDPGLPLALGTGCTVVSVDLETGSFEDYKFDPSKRSINVPLFIAAATPQLRDEIIGYYMRGKQNVLNDQEALNAYQDYVGRKEDFLKYLTHQQEFEKWLQSAGL